MTDLHIDSVTREIRVQADLAGEDKPLEATVHYEVVEEDGKTFVVPLTVKTSREWMTLLAAEVIKNQPVRIEIPAGLASAAMKILKI